MLLECAFAKEMLKGIVEITKRVLNNPFTQGQEPEEIIMFASGQFPLQVIGVGRLLSLLVAFLLAS